MSWHRRWGALCAGESGFIIGMETERITDRKILNCGRLIILAVFVQRT